MCQSPQQLVIYPNHKLLPSLDSDKNNWEKNTFYIPSPKEVSFVEDLTLKPTLVENATLAAGEAVALWWHGRKPGPTISKCNYSVGKLP